MVNIGIQCQKRVFIQAALYYTILSTFHREIKSQASPSMNLMRTEFKKKYCSSHKRDAWWILY